MHLPGFVDLQVNGHLGCDFSSPSMSAEQLRAVCDKLLAAGTAAFLPTMITAPMTVYERNLPILAKAIDSKLFRGRLLGIHLEGPFLTPKPGPIGAHRPEHTLAPEVDVLGRLVDLAGGFVRMLTLSPELPGAEKLIAWAVGRGICVSCGHTMATADDLARATDAGATAFTHLGNGLGQVVPRHANPIWAALAEDRLAATIITDGHHLPPPVIKSFLRAKGVERTIVISDAAPLAGMAPGRYRALGNEVVLEPDGKLHNPSKNCLVGSSSTMLQCMTHLASLDILSAAELRAVGLDNPLRLLGLSPTDLRPAGSVQYDPASLRFKKSVPARRDNPQSAID